MLSKYTLVYVVGGWVGLALGNFAYQAFGSQNYAEALHLSYFQLIATGWTAFIIQRHSTS